MLIDEPSKGLAPSIINNLISAFRELKRQKTTLLLVEQNFHMARALGDHVAVIGSNRKLLVFPLDQIPPMKRGQGVQLQKYKDGEISDITTFNLSDGLSWSAGAGRTRTETDIKGWLGMRAGSGKLPPNGFPRSNKFFQ